ncbi:hypothetical protein [Streptacidiphilus anmyonensis]|uniref:hypothetical protein n=1 Tax=Streptacidiphilus anmyonensis TaxID=405782 RepID=UPI0005A658E3|nr:hypothetical protein [Streptacidiphilus anmyonensis]
MAGGFRAWWNGQPNDAVRRARAAHLAEPKPWSRDAQAARCPVTETRREWTGKAMRWCVREFGLDAARRPVAAPGAGFVPPGWSGSQEQVRALVGWVCGVMDVDPESFSVEFFRTPEGEPSRKRHAIGRYRRVGGRNVVELDLREVGDPERLAGVVAHELGHKRLLGEPRRQRLPAEGEEMTDLVTVYLGMGIFTANGARRFARAARGWSALPLGDLTDEMLSASTHEGLSTVGYLTETELGFALACLCRLRGESEPPAWAGALHPGPRAALLQGLRYLAAHGLD